MLLLPGSKCTLAWLLTHIVLLSSQTSCLSVLATAPVAEHTHHARRLNQHHDTHHHDYEHERNSVSGFEEAHFPRSLSTNPLPPPIRPPDLSTPHNDANDPSSESHLICTPFGACEPCPADSLDEPFCRPFGNRRLMHCVNATSSSSSHPSPSQLRPESDGQQPPPPPQQPHSPPKEEGETLAWESCGRISRQERADFFEFVACNIAFVVISLAVVLWRSRVVRARQARVLAARIGVGGGRGRRA